jgi:hypothetical protein
MPNASALATMGKPSGLGGIICRRENDHNNWGVDGDSDKSGTSRSLQSIRKDLMIRCDRTKRWRRAWLVETLR